MTNKKTTTNESTQRAGARERIALPQANYNNPLRHYGNDFIALIMEMDGFIEKRATKEQLEEMLNNELRKKIFQKVVAAFEHSLAHPEARNDMRMLDRSTVEQYAVICNDLTARTCVEPPTLTLEYFFDRLRALGVLAESPEYFSIAERYEERYGIKNPNYKTTQEVADEETARFRAIREKYN